MMYRSVSGSMLTTTGVSRSLRRSRYSTTAAPIKKSKPPQHNVVRSRIAAERPFMGKPLVGQEVSLVCLSLHNYPCYYPSISACKVKSGIARALDIS